MIFSSPPKKYRLEPYTLSIDNKQIQCVDQYNFLGVIFGF